MLALVDDARAEGLDVTFDTYPSEWASTRLLIQLPRLDPGRRPGTAQGAPRRPVGARPAAGRVRGPRRGLHRAGRLGRRPARGLPPARQPALGVADPGRRDDRDRPRRGRRRSATCCCPRTSASAQVTSGPWSKTLPLFVAHPVGMVGTDSHVPRREAGAADVRHVPAHPRPVRARRGPAVARGGDPQDDRGARPPGSGCVTGACSATARSPTSSCSTRRRSARPRRTTSRARFPVGIEHVIVNGTLVVDGGAHTGATPGRGIRLGRD